MQLVTKTEKTLAMRLAHQRWALESFIRDIEKNSAELSPRSAFYYKAMAKDLRGLLSRLEVELEGVNFVEVD